MHVQMINLNGAKNTYGLHHLLIAGQVVHDVHSHVSDLGMNKNQMKTSN